MKTFTVTVERLSGLTLITVTGELDLLTLPAVEDAAVAVPFGGKVLHVDLSGVSFMDSSGLNLLLRLRRRMREESGCLVVSGLQEQPAGLLRLTETYELLTAAGSVGVMPPADRRTPSRV